MIQQPLSVTERRMALRHRTFKAAKIVFNDKASVIDCTAHNLSDRGACLKVANVFGIPSDFDVVIDGKTRPAKAIWRKQRELGIRFLDARNEA